MAPNSIIMFQGCFSSSEVKTALTKQFRKLEMRTDLKVPVASLIASLAIGSLLHGSVLNVMETCTEEVCSLGRLSIELH